MAASVFNTVRAAEVSIYVVRAFVRLRQVLADNQELAAKLMELERRVGAHDGAIVELIEAIRQLMMPRQPHAKRSIGFAPWSEDDEGRS